MLPTCFFWQRTFQFKCVTNRDADAPVHWVMNSHGRCVRGWLLWGTATSKWVNCFSSKGILGLLIKPNCLLIWQSTPAIEASDSLSLARLEKLPFYYPQGDSGAPIWLVQLLTVLWFALCIISSWVQADIMTAAFSTSEVVKKMYKKDFYPTSREDE